MLDLGFSTWAFPEDRAERSIEFARRHGFAALEICLLDPALFGEGRLIPSSAAAQTLRSAAAGLTLSLHAPVREISLGDERPAIRRAAMEALRRTVEASAAMGARTLVVHLNREGGPDLQPVAAPRPDPDAVRRAGEHLRAVAEEAALMGIDIAIENVGHNRFAVDAAYADLARLVDDLNLPNVGIALDVGHAHLHGDHCGGVAGAVDTFGDRVVHLHVHDNDRSLDQHRAVGRGTVDLTVLPPLLATNLSVPPILEIFPFADSDVERSLLESRDRLAELMTTRERYGVRAD